MSSEVLGKPGFCIVPEIDRPDPRLVAELGEFQAAIIGDGMGRRAIMDAGIKPLNRQSRFAGPAVTVEVHPADNLMIHAALRVAKEGDVLVINARGDLSHGIFGELTTRMPIRKGIAGVVIVRLRRRFPDLGTALGLGGLGVGIGAILPRFDATSPARSTCSGSDIRWPSPSARKRAKACRASPWPSVTRSASTSSTSMWKLVWPMVGC